MILVPPGVVENIVPPGVVEKSSGIWDSSVMRIFLLGIIWACEHACLAIGDADIIIYVLVFKFVYLTRLSQFLFDLQLLIQELLFFFLI